ncbi:Non-canonical purine NTP pyrophosphatase [ANME-1 cluster archaeon GoMg3.2]|nr:Non-canonical purine NTP pyrophosphatase [ANME-1 cluster archaeon GoMg3.2]
MKKELVFITSNKHKVKEIRALANSESKDITIKHIDYDYPEFQLDEIETVAEESVNYIRMYSEIKEEKPFFIEDSGLTIPALNGFPGPFSAFVFNKIGNAGILKLMVDTNGEERRATFKTVVAFCESLEKAPMLFVGTSEGRIANAARGEGGFGYDPIFELESANKTFAEMSTEEKNVVSHRGRAFRKLLDYIA